MIGGRDGSRLLRFLAASALGAVLVGCVSGRAQRTSRPIRPSGPSVASSPRTLLLALDGVPYRVVRRACERGAFRGWPEPAALVAPFPSMTNVGFATLFEPFGVGPSRGYEVHYFDRRRNEVVGAGLFSSSARSMAWHDLFDSYGKSLPAKIADYATPSRSARLEVARAEEILMTSPRDVVLAYVGATDGIQHLRGDDRAVDYLLGLDDEIRRIQRRHLKERGRPLRVVLFSDHGCGNVKVRAANGIHRALRRAGLRVVDSIAGPETVVAPTFGLVNYGALFLLPETAEAAALAIVTLDAVDLAAWRSGAEEITAVDRASRARIRWRDVPSGRRFAYEEDRGDPLRLSPARSALAAAGALDASGFADEDDWFRDTAFGDFPDPLRRLADALTGDRVLNRATVLFSLKPGRAWGWKSAQAGAWLKGGRLEGTHGGLDRDSTLGFLLVSDEALAPPRAVRADRALAEFAPALLNPGEDERASHAR